MAVRPTRRAATAHFDNGATHWYCALVESPLAPLFDELVRGCFGAAARVMRTAPLAGDASTRRYVRLWLAGGTAPPSAVAMVLADRGIAMSSEELAVFKEAPRELPYLNVHRFFVDIGVAVPALYADAADRGVLLLEDIGDTALWDAVQGQPEERVLALYQRAIDQLLLLQVEGTRRADAGCIAFQQAFDERLYIWEFEHFIEFGVRAPPGPAAASCGRRDPAAALRHHGAAARRAAARPQPS